MGHRQCDAADQRLSSSPRNELAGLQDPSVDTLVSSLRRSGAGMVAARRSASRARVAVRSVSCTTRRSDLASPRSKPIGPGRSSWRLVSPRPLKNGVSMPVARLTDPSREVLERTCRDGRSRRDGHPLRGCPSDRSCGEPAGSSRPAVPDSVHSIRSGVAAEQDAGGHGFATPACRHRLGGPREERQTPVRDRGEVTFPHPTGESITCGHASPTSRPES